MSRQSLAVSVVVTISLAEFACAAADPKTDNAQTAPKPEPEEVISQNPPDPHVPTQAKVPTEEEVPTLSSADGGAAADGTADGRDKTPEEPKGESVVVAETTTSTIEKNPDGTCTKHFKDNCTDGEPCNPPGPEPVACPPEKPKPAK